MHIEKEKLQEARIKIKHDMRQSKTYKNEDIDTSKSHLNYHFSIDKRTPQQRFDDRINEIYIYGKNGKYKNDINYLCSVVVQYPDNCPIDERTFFTCAVNILADKFGKENFVSAYVHNDEPGKSHLHFKFVPTVKLDKPKHGFTEKLCAKEVVNREMLKTFHQDIENQFFERYGHKISLRSAEHRQYVNDIYEFKSAQKTLENLDKKIDAKQVSYDELTESYKTLENQYKNAVKAYNSLADEFNTIQDELQKAQDILDKIRTYFQRHANQMLTLVEEEARNDLVKLNQEIDIYVDERGRD
ncbi:MAG: plasmid recombination protein [Lachnospiraceae bacterium]|nr:plasmid recombination protein [Lachnospiraceae bacterium]